MKLAVLVCSGRHPVSDATVLSRLDAQAIRLAADLARSVGGEALALHAGPDPEALRQALGRGLARAEHLALPEGADPVPALARHLAATAPDLILAGRRGQGGDESGCVPYAVAEALGLPLISDVVALAAGDAAGSLRLDQSLGRGVLRRIVAHGPLVVTIHSDAAPPFAYAYGQARRGTLTRLDPDPMAAEGGGPAFEERPYRRRPKLVKGAPTGGSAAERLKAATGEAGTAPSGRVLVGPDPDEAAREILSHLRQIGVLAPSPSAVRD